ncbi:MAG: bifunctional 3-deoxy-7-phosphoheptulonate synthase/chorismate mutase [Bacteroidia bacterium]|nr:bifunctional 3-deoxy-7-phosphoheptulonate synthase/chorismate mutase [Bacteroidia bacterium]
MLVQIDNQISPEQKQFISEKISRMHCRYTEVLVKQKVIWVVEHKDTIDIRAIGSLEGVSDVHFVPDPYPLVSNKWRVENTIIRLGDGVEIGGEKGEKIIAGPCSVESEEQVENVCRFLKSRQIRLMRGGIFKPRSSPYSFRGLGIEGLKMFHKTASSYGIKIVTEVMERKQIDEMLPYVDVFQVGARNSQNFNLLDALGKAGKPVLLKRGISGSIDELLYSAEYIYSAGNPDIILCERGIRSFENAYRNCFDVNAIAILKDKSHLPVFGDPSHGIGIRKLVPQIGMAALAAGADGIIVEIHPQPEKAMSDGQQTLNFGEFDILLNGIKQLFAC